MSMNTPGSANTPAPKKKNKGCLPIILIFLAFVVAGIIGSQKMNKDDNGSSAASPTVTFRNYVTATRSPAAQSTKLTSYPASPTASVWNSYDSSLHYFYAQLDYKEKSAFSCRYDAIALGRGNQWDISGFNLSSRQLERVKLAIEWDCPELMNASFYTRLFNFYNSADVNGRYTYFENYASEMRSMLSRADSALNSIRYRSEWGYSDYEKLLAYDRYVVKNCYYLLDNDGPEGTLHLDGDYRAPYSALVNGYAVCEGYARSTCYAMRRFGIPCIYVHGPTGSGHHAWNMVKTDGQWYQYDATWNDSNDDGRYIDYLPYFNITDERMYRSRSLDGEYAAYGFSMPRCTSTSANYYYKNGQYVGSNWASVVPGLIRSAYNRGQRYLGVMMANQSSFDAMLYSLKNDSKLYVQDVKYSYVANEKALFFYLIFR